MFAKLADSLPYDRLKLTHHPGHKTLDSIPSV
jgi:hypothetical protein